MSTSTHLRSVDAVGDIHTAVAAAMAAIVAGDAGARWTLLDLAHTSISAMVRREARRVGAWLDADEVDGLVLDAIDELVRAAGAWSPDGALPWVWARRRIFGLVHRHLGSFGRSYEELAEKLSEQPTPPARIHMDEVWPVLDDLARRHDGARRLHDQLGRVATARDAEIWLAVQLERDAGNRSPAVTVAADHDLRPETVRKVVQRVTERLATVADAGTESALAA